MDTVWATNDNVTTQHTPRSDQPAVGLPWLRVFCSKGPKHPTRLRCTTDNVSHCWKVGSDAQLRKCLSDNSKEGKYKYDFYIPQNTDEPSNYSRLLCEWCGVFHIASYAFSKNIKKLGQFSSRSVYLGNEEPWCTWCIKVFTRVLYSTLSCLVLLRSPQ